MANDLFIDIRARFAQFQDGLNQVQRDTTRMVGSLDRSFSTLRTTMGALAGVLSAGVFLSWTRNFIDAAATLDDMAEKTGASVEELSKLSQQAFISGTSLETVEQTLIQLSKHLQGSGEESKNTTRALNALGLEAAQLKDLDTADALRVIAVELNKFADGSGKAALAMDLLGKSGAQALPFLKDLANDAELAANVTAKQAAEAEALGKVWRSIMLEAQNVGRAIALDLLPYLKDLVEQFRIGKELAGGFWEALRLFGLSTITQSNAADKIGEITAEISKLEEKLASPRFAAPKWQSSISKQIDDLKKQLEFAKLLMRQAEDARLAGQGGNEAPTAPLRALKYTEAATAAKSKQLTITELLAKAEMKRLEQFEELEREGTIAAEKAAEAHRRTLEASLSVAQRIQKADVDALQYLQKEIDAFTVAPVYIDGLADAIDNVSESSRDMGHAIGTAFEDAVISGQKFSDVLKGLLDDITRILLRMTVTKPLEGALEGLLKGGLSSLVGGGSTASMARTEDIFGTGSGFREGQLLGSFATGTQYVPKTGPYLLHQGEAVVPAGQHGAIDARTYVDARGATPDFIPQIMSALSSHESRIRGLMSGDGFRRADGTRRLYKR
jgi:hypothetical protein